SQCRLPTEFGDFTLIGYEDVLDHRAHFALTFGDTSSEEPIPVRVHMADTLCDLFSAKRDECKWSLRSAMQQVSEEGKGVIVVLRKHEEGTELLDKIQQFQMKDRGIIQPEKIEKEKL
ncbi:MAG: bifunctional 3,4-dihydroxy-2-butanone-4-phosphate synthase/GTP cyclohydrolase II, partial [Thiotrichales bacterium]|nr:bifunctional 3,4-dihydroxy-2-butanone-4-phosphate synthase/GTP cyclohydrolase II [Thiotrichales bacterium]